MEAKDVCRQYNAVSLRKSFCMLFFLLLLLVVAIVALSHGASSLGFKELLPALFKDSGRSHGILMELRLPRIVMAILVGAGLSFAGTVFQAILKNPLASPYTLGIGSSAGFGAVLTIVFMPGVCNGFLMAGSAFFFTLVASSVVLGVARLKNSSSETMILTGIALMFLFTSLTSLFQYMGTMEQVQEIVFWFFGSFSKAGWWEIFISATMILVPVPILLRMAPDLNLLGAGDEAAKGLGVNVEKIRMLGVVLASLITAGSICFSGVIGFVGLVSPHIARMVIGSDHRFLLPASALFGAVLVMTADTLGRTLWFPQVIPIGIVTSFTGVPFFFYLLIKRTREYW
jgi:iron complex transport system permease protein